MSAKRLSPPEGSDRLKERRRKVRRRIRILFYILSVVLGGAFFWLTWQPYVRITNVDLVGGDSFVLQKVNGELSGSYFWIVPRNSYFFIPKSVIRASILSFNPRIQSVSIERESLTRIRVTLHERVPIATWCGLSPLPEEPLVPNDGVYCYLFDAEGFVYAATEVVTGTPPLNTFTLYDKLRNNAEEPLGATLAHAKALPNVFDFARQITSLGASVRTIIIRDDEVDVLVTSGTRITYVLGHEEAVFTDLTSAKNALNLTDGSLLYLDLRFPGKVYLKKKDASVTK